MRVTAEMSLYPLDGQPLPKILAFIAEVASDARVEVVVNQLSTQVRGELGVVMAVLTAAVERSFDCCRDRAHDDAELAAHLRAQLIDDDLETRIAGDRLDEPEDLLERLTLERIETHLGGDAHGSSYKR